MLRSLLLFTCLFTCLFCEQVRAQHVARLAIIYTEQFLTSFESEKVAKETVLKQIRQLNSTLKNQSANIEFVVVAQKVVSITTQRPDDACAEFSGIDMPQYKTEPNHDFVDFRNYRVENEADAIVLFTSTKNEYFKEGNNFGIACPTIRHANGESHDHALLIVERFGMDSLTMAHELGHFLGALHHEFQSLGNERATLMIANGNRQGLKRKNQFSNLPSLPEVSDIHIIRKNAYKSSQAFEIWIQNQ